MGPNRDTDQDLAVRRRSSQAQFRFELRHRRHCMPMFEMAGRLARSLFSHLLMKYLGPTTFLGVGKVVGQAGQVACFSFHSGFLTWSGFQVHA